MSDITAREYARTRLLAAAEDVGRTDLLPVEDPTLKASLANELALADEYEAVALGLLALLKAAGVDTVVALRHVYLALDSKYPPD